MYNKTSLLDSVCYLLYDLATALQTEITLFSNKVNEVKLMNMYTVLNKIIQDYI